MGVRILIGAHIRILALFALGIAVQAPHAFAQTNSNAKPPRVTIKPDVPETSHLEFVTEYIRQFAAVEEIRAAGEEENEKDKSENRLPFFGAVHTSTLFQLELGSQIRMLKRMRLNPPFEKLIPNITGFYERKVMIWQRMREINSEFIQGPKNSVDYGQLAAEMPQLRAELDYIDESLFHTAPMVFATLIDMKEDSKGHASHLIITKDEKAALISKLNDSFGAKLDQKNQNYMVSAAIVLRDYLNKGYKCSDEPWE